MADNNVGRYRAGAINGFDMFDTSNGHRRPIVCVAEDRKTHEPLLLLLLTSLSHHSNLPIKVFYPEANPEFLGAVRALDPRIIVNPTHLPGAYAWNVKPHAMLHLLDEGSEEVIWLDSDILVTSDILKSFLNLSRDVLVATEEGLCGDRNDDGKRARMWGFPVERTFPFVLNTAVLRVTRVHRPLLTRWKELLESPEYKRAQEKPWNKRPRHMLGDQDVLMALLCSKEFCTIPVKILRRGRDIIQYFGPFGFTLAERMTCMLRGMPTFIHAQGGKSWLTGQTAEMKSLRGRTEAAYQDLSPYLLAAEKLPPEPGRPLLPSPTGFSLLFRRLGLGYPPLVGLPLAAAFDLIRGVKRLMTIGRKPFDSTR